MMDSASHSSQSTTGLQKKILIVDDDAGLRRIISILLERLGYSTVSAGNAESALWEAGRQKFDAVLLDVVLPDRNGPEIISELRGLCPDAEIIMVTGDATTDAAVKSLNAGASAFLYKPLNNDELAAVLHERLDHQRLKIENRNLIEKLARSETLFRSIFDSAAVGICLCDINNEGRIVRTNSAFNKMLGFSAGELTGKCLWEFSHPDDQQETWDLLQELISHKRQSCRWEKRYIHRNNTVVWLDVETSLLQDGGGDFQYATSMAHDVTRRRKAEKEVRQLERRIGKLYIQQRRALAHELHDSASQELTGMVYLAQNLANRLKNSAPECVEAASEIRDGIQNTLRQVRGIAQGLNLVAVDSQGLMHALKKLAQNTRERFNIQCRFDCEEPIEMEDDQVSTELFQIAQEAVHNAVKHAGAKNITVSLQRGNVNGRIRLDIKDDGRGMTPDEIKGPGMGLRIIRHRAKVINGDLQLLSTLGNGTNISCEVDLSEKEEENN